MYDEEMEDTIISALKIAVLSATSIIMVVLIILFIIISYLF